MVEQLNAFAGTNGATTPMRPADLKDDEDFTYGVRTKVMEVSEANSIKKLISEKMAEEAYTNGGHRLHAAQVQGVHELMERLMALAPS